MELFSALITVVLLVLVPGLAYGQSPALILKAAAAGMKESRNRAVRWDHTALRYLARDQVLAMDPESCLLQLHCDTRRLDSQARARHRFRSAASRHHAAGFESRSGSPVYKCIQTTTMRAGVGGLHASVLKAVQPWLRGGYLDGNGHGDPADNRHGTPLCVRHAPPSPANFPLLQFHNEGIARRSGPRARESLADPAKARSAQPQANSAVNPPALIKPESLQQAIFLSGPAIKTSFSPLFLLLIIPLSRTKVFSLSRPPEERCI